MTADVRIGFIEALAVALIVLRLAHVVEWSWWWVTAPLWWLVLGPLVIHALHVLKWKVQRKRARRWVTEAELRDAERKTFGE